MVPVWFHVVPTTSIALKMLVYPSQNLQSWRGSRMVPCGSQSASRLGAFGFPQQNLFSQRGSCVVPHGSHCRSAARASSFIQQDLESQRRSCMAPCGFQSASSLGVRRFGAWTSDVCCGDCAGEGVWIHISNPKSRMVHWAELRGQGRTQEASNGHGRI